MGGDRAPSAVLQGVDEVLPKLGEDESVVLFGPEEVVSEAVADWRPVHPVGHTATTQVIGMADSPTRAFQQKPDSSIAQGFAALKAGEIDIFISAGNTGAILVGALYSIGAIEGVQRPAIATLVPKEDGGTGLLLDIGANADVKQDALVQFGLLGSLYLEHVIGIERPRVSLLSLGHEPEKGNRVTQAAYPLMEEHPDIRFVGNIEGYDLFGDTADVVVCDGFTGNVVLKVSEGIFQVMRRRGYRDSYLSRFDYESYGGTPVLGVRRPVIIGHGVSSPRAFSQMILQAREVVSSRLTDKIKGAFHTKTTL
jgi:glycerol-3-phosphate acyltransferase PlsX